MNRSITTLALTVLLATAGCAGFSGVEPPASASTTTASLPATTTTTTTTTAAATTDTAQSEPGWPAPLVDVRVEDDGVGSVVWPTVAPHDGVVRTYVYAANTSYVPYLNAAKNGTGRFAFGDQRVRIVHIVDGEKCILAAGDVTRTGVEWRSGVTLANVSDATVERAAANASVSFRRVDQEFGDPDWVANVTESGPGHLVFEGYIAGETPLMLYGGSLHNGSSPMVYEGNYLKIYYEDGDERRLVRVFDPYNETEVSA